MSAVLLSLAAVIIVIAALGLGLRQARLRGVAEAQARKIKALSDAQEIESRPLPARDVLLDRMHRRSGDAAALPQAGRQSGDGAGAHG